MWCVGGRRQATTRQMKKNSSTRGPRKHHTKTLLVSRASQHVHSNSSTARPRAVLHVVLSSMRQIDKCPTTTAARRNMGHKSRFCNIYRPPHPSPPPLHRCTRSLMHKLPLTAFFCPEHAATENTPPFCRKQPPPPNISLVGAHTLEWKTNGHRFQDST